MDRLLSPATREEAQPSAWPTGQRGGGDKARLSNSNTSQLRGIKPLTSRLQNVDLKANGGQCEYSACPSMQLRKWRGAALHILCWGSQPFTHMHNAAHLEQGKNAPLSLMPQKVAEEVQGCGISCPVLPAHHPNPQPTLSSAKALPSSSHPSKWFGKLRGAALRPQPLTQTQTAQQQTVHPCTLCHFQPTLSSAKALPSPSRPSRWMWRLRGTAAHIRPLPTSPTTQQHASQTDSLP